MNTYKVSPEMVAQATGVSRDEVVSRYRTAMGLPDMKRAADTPQPIDPDVARDLISRSMVGGVPTSEFEKYGGYDAVRAAAGNFGMPLAAHALSSKGNYGLDMTPGAAASTIGDPAAVFSWLPDEQARQYAVDNNLNTRQLAQLAVQADPANANRALDQIDWSFLNAKPSTTGGSQVSAMPQAPTLAEYRAITRAVEDADTVQGQLDTILSRESPLLKRAEAYARDKAASAGLLNSSLAATAGYAAMVDKALPIAQQDAETYFKQALTNQEYQNQAELTNVNWANKFAENAYVTQLDFWKQSNLMSKEYDLKANLLATEYNFKDKLQQAQLDSDMQKVFIGTYTDTLKEIDRILADPNLDDASKRTMVNKYVESINKLADSAGAVGTPLPDFDFSQYYVEGSDATYTGSSPGNTANDLYNGGGSRWEELSAWDQWGAYERFVNGDGPPVPLPTKERPLILDVSND